jgi:hypothetical protein
VTRGALLGLACVCLAVVPAGAQARRLVGEWAGTWRSGGSRDVVLITVDAVNGENVQGVIYMAVTTPTTYGYYNRDVPFSGTFDGATLRFGIPPALSVSLTVTGDRMQGVVQGQQTFGTLDLERKRQ